VDDIGDPDLPESFAFEYGLKTHKLPMDLAPVNRDDQFKGYSWYAAIPVLKDFKLLVDGKPIEEDYPQRLVIVNDIGMSFSFVTNSGCEVIDWNNLLVAAWGARNYGNGDFTILITESSEWAKTRSLHEPFSLVCAAQYVGFSYNDNGDSDSYDTQVDYFQDEAIHTIVEILGGALQAAQLCILGALDWNVTQALEKAGLIEVRLYKDEKGFWRTDIPVSA